MPRTTRKKRTRQEIVLLQPQGLAFSSYETGILTTLTRERQARPETGILTHETGKRCRSQEILHRQVKVMGTSCKILNCYFIILRM